MSITDHLRNISENHCGIPYPHVKYLQSLKEDGFEPKVIYDIGACVMHWTKEARKIWPDAKIIMFDAFQPAEFLFKESGLDYYVGVIGNEDDKIVKFYQNDLMPGGNSYYKENNDHVFPEDKFIEQKMMTLDTIVKNMNFPLPDLIKIDVQGAERDIVEGATLCLKSAKHFVVEMQCVEYNRGAPKVFETLPYIESLGWKCVAHKFSDNGPDADYGFVKI